MTAESETYPHLTEAVAWKDAQDAELQRFLHGESYKPPFLLRVIARDYPLLETLCYAPPEERGRLLKGIRTHLTENYGMEVPQWVWTALEEAA